MHAVRAVRYGIKALSSDLRYPTISSIKGKAAIRILNIQLLERDPRQVGCSFWVYRSYSSEAAIKHQTEVGLFEDSAEENFYAEDEPLSADSDEQATVDGSQANDPPSPGFEKRPRLPTSQKKLNRLLSRHVMHDVPEEELEEKFLKGSGPGGQAINKTNSAVHLLHIPTGIRIRAQPSRLRGKNRGAARKLLREKLDLLRAKGLYPLSEGASNGSLAEDIVINPDDMGEHEPSVESDTEATTGVEKLEESSPPVMGKKAAKQVRKEAKKAHEVMLATSYSRTEIQVAKIRARKANKGKKQKKKIREKEVAAAEAAAASGHDANAKAAVT